MIPATGKDQRGLALGLCRLAEEHKSNGAVSVSKGRGSPNKVLGVKILYCWQVEKSWLVFKWSSVWSCDLSKKKVVTKCSNSSNRW